LVCCDYAGVPHGSTDQADAGIKLNGCFTRINKCRDNAAAPPTAARTWPVI